jgi:hypothetical protein
MAELLTCGHETYTFPKLSYYRLAYRHNLHLLILPLKYRALNIYFKILSGVFQIKNTSLHLIWKG